MIISSSLKGLGPTTVGIRRAVVAAAGFAAFGVTLYRMPAWLDAWNIAAVAAAVLGAAVFLIVTIAVAIRGSAEAVERVVTEMSFCVLALIVAEAILLVRAPERWSSDPAVQRIVLRERAAREHGVDYDERLESEVAHDLRSSGLDAVPGFAGGAVAEPAVANAVRELGLLPLSNVSNVMVAECNEGTGYLQYRSDEFGFNNPSGVAAGPADVAVIGASLALGHCVPPSTSAVDRVRARFPRTANFGVAGSRVLSHLGVFREYVEPLEPPVVVWVLNLNFAEPRAETSQPILMRYLKDESFSQGLRQRQHEVDSFVREVVVPVSLRRDRDLREKIDAASTLPLDRVIKLTEVRGIVRAGIATERPLERPDLSTFALAVDRVAETVAGWGGKLIVVIAPSYQTSVGRGVDVLRYEAISDVLRDAGVNVVDGAALFAAEPDFRSLYTLRMDNHPSERGHALLGEAIVAAIESEGEDR
jgi:hypothetical protein